MKHEAEQEGSKAGRQGTEGLEASGAQVTKDFF